MAKKFYKKFTRPNIKRTIRRAKEKHGHIKPSYNISSKHPVKIIENFPEINSDSVFIVGGGSSLKDFNFKWLNEYDTIVVNKAIEYIDNPTYFITMDYTFFQKSKMSISQISDKAKHSYFILNTAHDYIKKINNVWIDTRNNYPYKNLYKLDGIIKSEKNYDIVTGFGKNIENFTHGDNSGYCAIQLAILLGYKNIYLLGFDYNITKNTHFHNDYRLNSSQFRGKLNSYKNNFIKSYRKSQLNNIYSCSEASSLNSFLEYIPIWKAFKYTKESINELNDELNDNLNENKPKIGDIEKPISYNDGLDNLLVVGYYTVKTPYEKEAQKLINSLKKLKLNHYIQGVNNLGNWQANTRYKAQFMLDMLKKFPDKRLLYVDCDAVVHKLPELFINYKADIACRWQSFKWRKNECLSGTIYMENNERTHKLCRIWKNINLSQGNKTKQLEQWNLDEAIKLMKKDSKLNVKNLPAGYTYIFDSMRKMYPNENVVIEHYQASRRLRNKVSNKNK